MGNTEDSTDPEKTEVIRPTDDEKTVVLPPDVQPAPAPAPSGLGGADGAADERTVVVPRAAAPPPVVTWETSSEPPHSGFSPPTRGPGPSAAPPPPRPAPAPAAQPYQPNPPGPFGFPGAGPHKPGRRSVKKWLIPVVAAVVVVVAVLTALAVFRPGPVKALMDDKLDVATAQSQVHTVLTDKGTGYGLTDVGNVVCNGGADPLISKGATFTCQFTVGGRQNQAVMTFLNDSGTYSVGRPQ